MRMKKKLAVVVMAVAARLNYLGSQRLHGLPLRSDMDSTPGSGRTGGRSRETLPPSCPAAPPISRHSPSPNRPLAYLSPHSFT